LLVSLYSEENTDTEKRIYERAGGSRSARRHVYDPGLWIALVYKDSSRPYRYEIVQRGKYSFLRAINRQHAQNGLTKIVEVLQ
jgi:hypothetical protein